MLTSNINIKDDDYDYDYNYESEYDMIIETMIVFRQ
jgi:hypothetical protein